VSRGRQDSIFMVKKKRSEAQDIYPKSCSGSYQDDNGKFSYSIKNVDIENCKRVCSETDLCSGFRHTFTANRCFWAEINGKPSYSNLVNTGYDIYLKLKRIWNVHDEHRLIVKDTEQASS